MSQKKSSVYLWSGRIGWAGVGAMFDFFGSIFYGFMMFCSAMIAFPIPFLIAVMMMAFSSTMLYAIIKRILR